MIASIFTILIAFSLLTWHGVLGLCEEALVVDACEAEVKETFWIKKLSTLSHANWEIQKTLRNRLVAIKSHPIPPSPHPISPDHPIKVLFWDDTSIRTIVNGTNYALESCSVPCKAVFDQKELRNAHMVLTQFMDDTVLDAITQLSPWQQKVLMNMWPHRLHCNPIAVIGLRHMLVSYSRYADVQIDFSHAFQMPPPYVPIKEKSNRALMAVFLNEPIDNEDSKFRSTYLQALSRLIKIDFYGEFMHTPDLPLVKDITEIAKIRQKYYFSFVSEPIYYDDYVTDEIYRALIPNSIPVYLGAPNIDEFLPVDDDHKIIIDVRHFFNPVNLARRLVQLSRDPLEYSEYFKWRQTMIDAGRNTIDTRKSFRATGEDSFVCRLCKDYHRRSLIRKY